MRRELDRGGLNGAVEHLLHAWVNVVRYQGSEVGEAVGNDVAARLDNGPEGQVDSGPCAPVSVARAIGIDILVLTRPVFKLVCRLCKEYFRADDGCDDAPGRSISCPRAGEEVPYKLATKKIPTRATRFAVGSFSPQTVLSGRPIMRKSRKIPGRVWALK